MKSTEESIASPNDYIEPSSDVRRLREKRKPSFGKQVLRLLLGGHIRWHITFWAIQGVRALLNVSSTSKSTKHLAASLIKGFLYWGYFWIFIEYVVHRFVLHSILEGNHGKHHGHPRSERFMHIPMLVIVSIAYAVEFSHHHVLFFPT